MSVESEILRIQHNIANAYAAVAEKGGEVPLQPTSANLAAGVASIQTGVTQEELEAALSAKQDKLTGAPGQVVGFNAQGAAQAVRGWSNPNLLDNWYFADPVNQRGQTEYTGGGYTIDRWTSLGGFPSATLTADGVRLSDGDFGQIIEYGRLVPAEYTMTVLTTGNHLISNSFTILQNDTTQYYGDTDTSSNIKIEFIYRWDSSNVNHLFFIDSNGSGESMIAAKLELGAQQTLAHQDADGSWVLNDPPPNKALELAKCQRYFVRYGSANKQSLVGYGVPYSTGKAATQISLPVPMRATPTVVKNGDIKLSSAYGTKEVSNMLVAYVTQNELTLDVTSEGLTVGEMSRLNIPAGSYLDFSADL